MLLLSLLLNLGVSLIYTGVVSNPLETDPEGIEERFYLGEPGAKDKIAVVRVTGVISGAGIRFPLRQLETAARDPRVKAVVLRIDSPGGTVTASEELYRNVINLRDNTGRRFTGTGPKPVSVSMGGVAASGGYYVAVAGHPISAEPTTITGSIGVFVAIPNVAELGEKYGIKMELIKAGNIKAAGSFFHTLAPEERQTWQDTVDAAYDQFLDTIASNRPKLTTKHLRDTVVIERMVPKRDEKGNAILDAKAQPVEVLYQRRLADGGTLTPKDAKLHGLIDRIEDLPATIRAAAGQHGITSFKAVVYEPRKGLVERLTGLPIQTGAQSSFNLGQFPAAMTPRLWYLAPSVDLGLLHEVP
ncbi:MAG TPA: S49 family peptidase [Gemmata sp.]|nr:S49 family peptidase [Gemmata sp.]